MQSTVMVVDDSTDDLAIMQRVLVNTGLTLNIKTVEKGETAIHLLRKNTVNPSLIFLDLKMPGMDGIETVRQIKADDKLRHIPVVILTNSTLEEEKKAAYAAGANLFLHKSANLDQFCGVIKSLLVRLLKI